MARKGGVKLAGKFVKGLLDIFESNIFELRYFSFNSEFPKMRNRFRNNKSHVMSHKLSASVQRGSNFGSVKL